MQGSFCGSDYPDLSGYPLKNDGAGKTDFITDGFLCCCVDSHGRLGRKSGRIDDADEDHGYDKAQIIEVLTEQVDDRYSSTLSRRRYRIFLREKKSLHIK